MEPTPETPTPPQTPSQPASLALHARLQGVVFWLALGTTLLSALFLGANRPVSWLALAAIALALFAVQAGLDLFDRDAPGRWRRILPVAILYLGVIGWAMIQTGRRRSQPGRIRPGPRSGLRRAQSRSTRGRPGRGCCGFWPMRRCSGLRPRAADPRSGPGA